MRQSRPTMRTASWAMTQFRDAAIDLLTKDRAAEHLRLYFYAVTLPGWLQLAAAIKTWSTAREGRKVTAYIGTDHALTAPDALTTMDSDDVEVFLLRHYRGVFHPKVIWFSAANGGHLLAGSNNLTEDGLRNNIEFATLTVLDSPDAQLEKWHETIHAASERMNPSLLKSYAKEKEQYGSSRAKSRKAETFTWSKRTSGDHLRNETAVVSGLGGIVSGDLILEVMPRETSSEGRQVQIPLVVAESVFRLGENLGDKVDLTLINAATNESRSLTLTRNTNSTARLSIRELEYRSRPCVLLFRRRNAHTFDFEIVRRAIDPGRYDDLLELCPQKRSRRWAIR